MIRSLAVLGALAGCAGTTAYTGATPPIVGTLPAPVAKQDPPPPPKGSAGPAPTDKDHRAAQERGAGQ